MLQKSNKATVKKKDPALVFAALGDKTRLTLVSKLSHGQLRSISDLTAGSQLTRQAVTKHLRILENVGLVHSVRQGRESLFAFDAKPLANLKEYLDFVSRQWDEALLRLKTFVED